MSAGKVWKRSRNVTLSGALYVLTESGDGVQRRGELVGGPAMNACPIGGYFTGRWHDYVTATRAKDSKRVNIAKRQMGTDKAVRLALHFLAGEEIEDADAPRGGDA